MTTFFRNIDHIDSLLHKKRRGFSTQMRDMLGISSGTVALWKKGSIPHQNTLEHFARILSETLSQNLQKEVVITSEDLKNGDVEKIINNAKENPPASRLKTNDQVNEKKEQYQAGQQITFLMPQQKGWWDKLYPHKVHPVPVLNKIPAGDVVNFNDQQFPVGYADEYVSSDVRDSNAYALVVRGDSMNPTLMEGDYVVVSPNAEPQNGCVVVFRLQGEDAGIKRYKKLGTKVLLSPDNKEFNVIECDISDLKFIHRVVEVTKKL